MPTYEYECSDCGYTFEAFQKISDAPLEVCPKCGGRVKRLIGGGMGIIFKGSGFYVTDYKSSGGSNGNGKSVSSKSNTGDEKTKVAESKKEKASSESSASDKSSPKSSDK